MGLIFKSILGLGLLGVITIGYLVILGTTDLRTTEVQNAPNEQKAKVLLQKMAEAHGVNNWESINTYTVKFEDVFFGEIGKISHSFAEDSVQLLLHYIPNSYDGSLEFLTGDWTGVKWGMQSWKTYLDTPRKGFRFKKKEEIEFWLPTYQYFIEFPMRIQKANAIAYAGEKTIDGIACEGVLASWNTTDPQREVDQYLIWLNKENNTITKLEYTIRDTYNFLRGAAYFNDYIVFEGLLLPTKMPVESNLINEGFLHEMRILNFSKNLISQKELRPNLALRKMGDEKPISAGSSD